MNRRDVLALGSGLAPLLLAGRAFAAPQTQARLLVVFLRGAYDAASLLVPVSSDFYYASRPTIAIARPDPANPSAAVPLTAELGQPIQGSRNFGSGFMNRLAGQLNGAQPIAFTQQVPLTFQGGRPIPNIAMGGVGRPGLD